jgi:hypothetical protein
VKISVQIDPRSRKALRDLSKSLKQASVEALGRNLVKTSAKSLLDRVHRRLEEVGSEDLAKELELVESDGAVGLAVLPKRKRIGMADLLPKHAVFVFARKDGKVPPYVALMERGNPWFGPLIPTLPDGVSAVVVIRDITSSEAGQLRVKTEQSRDEILKSMKDAGIVPNMKLVSVIFDVGFAGQRAERGIGREGTLGVWRSSVMDSMQVPDGTLDQMERVLFGGKRWILTTRGGSRKLGATEAKLIAEEALN